MLGMVVHVCNLSNLEAEEEDHKLEASLGHITSSRPAQVTWQDPVCKLKGGLGSWMMKGLMIQDTQRGIKTLQRLEADSNNQ
jgi:hypothetical protein